MATILRFPFWRRGLSTPCPTCGAPRQPAPCHRGHRDGLQRCTSCGVAEHDCARCDWDILDGDESAF